MPQPNYPNINVFNDRLNRPKVMSGCWSSSGRLFTALARQWQNGTELFRSRANSLPGANQPIGPWPVRLPFVGPAIFPIFFNMAACRNHTSSYRCIVGLTKHSPVIPTQTLSLHNTKNHGYGKYSLTDVYGLCDFPHFLTRQHADTIQEHHATVL